MSQMTIPWQSLSEVALNGIIEDFVTREGTEYGFHDVNLGQKVNQVRWQLRDETVFIVFDSDLDSCSIVPAKDVPAKDIDSC